MTTETKPVAYPGRDDLNRAQARLRRAFARTFKEGIRHDSKLIPELAKLVAEAADTLSRIASDAEQLESASVRHQRALKQQEDKIRATLRPAARRGDARAVSLLARIDARAARRPGPAPDDAA
ncbi:hypothetical protein [Streptomyces sp. NPDC001978]|uniref:hypothetical protein n=1 Tax=Streptomyces sp. NPDC001978 TaxID=3364627 RepID=UPI00368AAEC2